MKEKKKNPTFDELVHGGYKEPFGVKQILTSIAIGLILMAAAAGWVMLMLLIISFMSLGYLHFNIKWMIVIAVIAAIITGIIFTIFRIKKYKKYYAA